jgi:cytochrome oxidase assembly protein ShyY1
VTAWRLARTRRWLGYLALAVVFAIVCSALGMWQFARRAEARAEIGRIVANYDSEPVALEDALPTLDSYEEGAKWTPVRVSGSYLVDEQILARNRPLSGQPGFEVLVPFQLDSGDILVVNRGWVPTGREQDSPDSVPAAPEGPVDVVVRLQAGEPTLPGRTAPEGQISSIQLEEIAADLDRATYTGAYGLMAEETPAPAERPTPEGRPELDEGPHLSYALQWFVFALLGFIFYGYLLRQEVRVINADEPDERERAAERERRRAAKRSDIDEEDAALDRVGAGR